jgi:hypothetical protein
VILTSFCFLRRKLRSINDKFHICIEHDSGSQSSIGQPVTSNQVYAVICRFPDMFVKAEGRIMLMI